MKAKMRVAAVCPPTLTNVPVARRASPDSETRPEPAPAGASSKGRGSLGRLGVARDDKSSLQQRVAAQLRFRRAFTVGYSIWVAFLGIDWMMVSYLDASSFTHLALPRLAVIVAVFPVLVRLYRNPPLTQRMLTVLDLIGYTAPSLALAIMCARFRGLASPYAPGLCLVLLARTVTAQDPWRRGLAMSGAPVVGYYAVLFASAWVLPTVASQFRDAAAVSMLLLSAAYILGTYIFLVVGGHVVYSLRRQISEARSLGQYRLKRRLASGGMGEVWVAYHPGLKRDVAIKILLNELKETSKNAVRRFEREARATAELLHPNTVRVFDYGATEDGLFYYVMELLHGETLACYVDRRGPLSPARAVHIIGQAARAIAEAHSRGIVHRDIKPENLVLTSLGGEHDFVKVIDFGIARIPEADDTKMTVTGRLMGTPLYMSPEVVLGKSADARSDVYGLGAVLYYLLTGSHPFQGGNPSALVFAQVHNAPVSPSVRLGTALPLDLEALVMRALDKDPGQRHKTASEFAAALSACARGARWVAAESGRVPLLSSRPPPRYSSIPEKPFNSGMRRRETNTGR